MTGDSPTLGDVIRRFTGALLHRRGALVTPAQHAILWTLGRCHTAALGGHLRRCDHCGAEHPSYNGCGNRHCPSCLGERSAKWLRDRSAELLPVPYFHVVFTVPSEIAALTLGNKEAMFTILFRAASETLLEIGADPKHLGARLGFLAILHTWTQTLDFHPHLHCIVPGGGLSPDGARWVSARPRYFLPYEVLSKRFRNRFLDALVEAVRAGEIRFAGSTAALVDEVRFADFVAEQRAKKWVVYLKPPFGSPEQVLKYLARYTHRVAISDKRIVEVGGDSVRFTYRDRANGDRQREMVLDGVEFLRRFLLHVLPSHFVRIRYYGFLGSRGRAENLARCRQLIGASGCESPPDPACTGEAERDPKPKNQCPTCGVGTLLVVTDLPPEEWNPGRVPWEPWDTS
jgi:Putative transposase/Transposase zinc-binding domain